MILAALAPITLAALLVHHALSDQPSKPRSIVDINPYTAKYGPGYVLQNPASLGAWPTSQEAFTQKLNGDRRALDHGVLSYSKVKPLEVGAYAVFRVIVTDVGKHRPQLTAFPLSRAGYVIDGQDIPTGGIVSVKAVCEDLKCEPESSTRQAVLAESDSGNWAWRLSAENPGKAHVLLTVTTYDRNSNIALSDPAPIEITIAVRANFSYRLRTLTSAAGGLLQWIGPGLAFASAAAAWRWRKKRQAAPPHIDTKPIPEHPAHSTGGTARARSCAGGEGEQGQRAGREPPRPAGSPPG